VRAPLPLLALAAACLLAGACGGDPPSPESVVRAWSESLNAGDNESAGELFAPGAEVSQVGQVTTLPDEEAATAFTAALPCSGEIVSLRARGETVTTVFRLADRETSPCDGPGNEVTAIFRVREGRIVELRQLPAEPGQDAPGDQA
jgi:hypothetical protein